MPLKLSPIKHTSQYVEFSVTFYRTPLPKITINQVVANPVIFVSFNRYFLTAVRNLPYNALPCLFQQDYEKNTIADFGMEEHGGNYC